MTQRKKNDGANGERDDDSPERLEAKIEETRGIISADIQAIGEKLSPERLKQEAKETMLEAKDAAAEKVIEVTDAVVEKLTDAKDAVAEKFTEVKDATVDTVSKAVESVAETLDDAREGVLRAGDATVKFVGRNAIPLGLIGVGVAWLIASNRRRSANGSDQTPSKARGTRRAVSDGAIRVKDMASRAEHAVAEEAARARSFAQGELTRVKRASRELAHENPLLLGAAALAAGVGVGLLLPATQKENELLGPSRDRLLGEAKDTVHEIGEAARDLSHSVTETAHDVASSLSGS